MLFKSFETVFGQKSLQFANGLDGHSRRRQYDGSFSHDKISKYMHTFTKLTERVEVKWLQKGNDDHINLTEDCFLYAIQGSLLSVIGDHFGDEKLFLEFKTSYEKVWYTLEDNLKTGSHLDEKLQDEFDKALSFLKKSIVDTIAQRKKDDLYLQGDLFIDELIALWSDEETIADDAITFLIAGFHTGANLFIWAIYFIATHQDVQEKLLEEVHKVIGDKESVDENNYSEFVYLMQILQETLRCAVIAPWAARFQDIDSELGGHKVENNTPVIQALGVMMKDAQIWPEPNKFDPERFNAENKKKMSHYDYVPFGFSGKRKCPAYRLSYWNAVVLIATLVRRFEIILCEDQVVTPVYGLVTHPQEDVWVKIRKRQ